MISTRVTHNFVEIKCNSLEEIIFKDCDNSLRRELIEELTYALGALYDLENKELIINIIDQ